MSNKNPETDYSQLASAVGFAFAQKVKGLHTALPAHIVKYSAATKRATVKPAIMLRMTDGSTMSRALIANVPVLHPSGGGYLVHLPLAAGDPVMLIFSERGISKFKKAFAHSPPDFDGMLSEKDAVAIPGFGAISVTPAGDGLTVQTEDGASFIEITPERVTVTAPGGLVINGGVTVAGGLTATGDIALSGGAVTHNGKNIGDDHHHEGVVSGNSNTGPPV